MISPENFTNEVRELLTDHWEAPMEIKKIDKNQLGIILGVQGEQQFFILEITEVEGT